MLSVQDVVFGGDAAGNVSRRQFARWKLGCISLLTLLFACNLHGITCREAGAKDDGRHMRLVVGTLLFTLAVLWEIKLGALEHTLLGPARAALGAVVLHAGVQGLRRRFSADAYRVLADLALIVPLPLAWW